MKHTLLVMVLAITSLGLYACDGCGSGAGQAGWGIMPSNSQHFIGLRVRHRSFLTQPHSIGNMTSGGSNDYFVRAEISGRYSLKNGLMLLATMPFQFGQTGMQMQYGLGDMALTIAGSILEPNESESFKHQLMGGLGIETPTGHFQFDHEIPAVVQQGSKSWDLTSMLMYSLRYNKSGMQLECNYKYSGVNTEHYQFGQMFSGALRAFRTLDINSWRFVPSLAVTQEVWGQDVQDTRYDIDVKYTGGSLLTAAAGLDIFTTRFSVGVEYGRSLHSHIAEGYSSLKHHAQVRLLLFII